MIKNGDNVILKFNTYDGELSRYKGKAYVYESMENATRYSYSHCETLVEYAPVKHARWDLADDGDGVVCSECGVDFCLLIHETDNFNYCPRCGSKMDQPKLTQEEFTSLHCSVCGSQRCDGINSEWFDGCKFKDHLN